MIEITVRDERSPRGRSVMIPRSIIDDPGPLQSVIERLVEWTENERAYEVDPFGVVSISLTDEGVIADLIREGEVVATWGATAQELAEDYVR